QNKQWLKKINAINENYSRLGYILTLRQLYYQLVTRDIIPNSDKEYKKLSVLLTKGRMAGVVDLDAMEDRGRKPRIPYYVTGVDDALEDTIKLYRLDRLEDQDVYVEAWIEKEVLSNIFSIVIEKYHAVLMNNTGYL